MSEEQPTAKQTASLIELARIKAKTEGSWVVGSVTGLAIVFAVMMFNVAMVASGDKSNLWILGLSMPLFMLSSIATTMSILDYKEAMFDRYLLARKDNREHS